MNRWFKYIRYIIVIFSIALAIILWTVFSRIIPDPILVDIRLGQVYAFLAVVYLYLALLPSALYLNFPQAPFKPIFLRARRAIGFSAFIFAFLHGSIEFLKLLGGLDGLKYLTSKYLLAVILGFVALLILTAMAAASFDWAVKKLGRNWKQLHRLVYLASVAIVIHALIIGSAFIDLSAAIPTVFFLALSVLAILEAMRIEIVVARKYPRIPRYIVSGILILVFLAAILYQYLQGGLALHNHG